MTKPEAKMLSAVPVLARPATGRWLQYSSFVLWASFVIRHLDYVISLLVNRTMGKLPELAQISKWKCFRAAAMLAQQDDGYDHASTART